MYPDDTPPPPPPPVPARLLDFTIQSQEQSEWCWAANAASVSKFYDPLSTWTQCQLANDAFALTTCCQDGTTDQCNQAYHVDVALVMVSRYGRTLKTRLADADIRMEIDNGRPVCVMIRWPDQNNHFVTIYGYSGTFYDIADPLWGLSMVEAATFPQQYHSGADWAETYLTKP